MSITEMATTAEDYNHWLGRAIKVRLAEKSIKHKTVAAALGHQHITTTAIYLKRRQTVADIRPFTPDYGASDDLDPV